MTTYRSSFERALTKAFIRRYLFSTIHLVAFWKQVIQLVLLTNLLFLPMYAAFYEGRAICLAESTAHTLWFESVALIGRAKPMTQFEWETRQKSIAPVLPLLRLAVYVILSLPYAVCWQRIGQSVIRIIRRCKTSIITWQFAIGQVAAACFGMLYGPFEMFASLFAFAFLFVPSPPSNAGEVEIYEKEYDVTGSICVPNDFQKDEYVPSGIADRIVTSLIYRPIAQAWQRIVCSASTFCWSVSLAAIIVNLLLRLGIVTSVGVYIWCLFAISIPHLILNRRYADDIEDEWIWPTWSSSRSIERVKPLGTSIDIVLRLCVYALLIGSVQNITFAACILYVAFIDLFMACIAIRNPFLFLSCMRDQTQPNCVLPTVPVVPVTEGTTAAYSRRCGTNVELETVPEVEDSSIADDVSSNGYGRMKRPAMKRHTDYYTGQTQGYRVQWSFVPSDYRRRRRHP